MLNFLLWGFNEWLRGGDSLQNDCISKPEQLREDKFFGNLMNFREFIQVFVFEPLNGLISEVYWPAIGAPLLCNIKFEFS